jgi:GxxExxY protein
MSKLLDEQNLKYPILHKITGAAMEVHREYKPGLLESAYEAALKYVLEQEGLKVDKQVYLPIYWKGVQLDQNYRVDLLVNNEVIIELKAVSFVSGDHRRQLINYMRLMKLPFGMIMNFGANSLYSEWYELNRLTDHIQKIRTMR